MAPALSPFFRDSSFDPFLFATIGEERNGMLLSVQSALARLDLDPWFEAASLSRLPAIAATERLTSLLSSSPNTQLKAPAPATIMRLVELLPQAARVASWSSGAAVVTKSKISRSMAAFILFAIVMIFAVQFAQRRDPREPSGGVATPTTNLTERGAAKVRGQ